MFRGDDREKEALLGRARRGDATALGGLLEAYRASLTLLARLQIGRGLRGKAEDADVVQECFLAAARRFPHFRGETRAEFRSWLRRILASRLAHLVRRYAGTQARDVRLERPLEYCPGQASRAHDRGLVAVETSPSQCASMREQGALLEDAVAALPDDYREVILLRHQEGLSFAQVAERMARSLDSVEKLWLRAITRLRRAVGEGA